MTAIEVFGVGEFRQNATEIIKKVEETATPVRVTRHGKPVVEIRPLSGDASDLLGSVTVADGVDLSRPALDDGNWAANR